MRSTIQLILLLSLSCVSRAQYCEYFETHSKTELDSIGWDASPNNGWGVQKTGAYSGKSTFVNAGIGSYLNLASECNTSSVSTETVSFMYTFSSGSGTFSVGIQNPYNLSDIVWLDTLAIVPNWTYYSISFTSPFDPYKFVFHLESTTPSCKIGIDNLCFANSTALGICMLLPIELSYFNAEVVGNEPSSNIGLNWGTASELNSNSFTVMRSNGDSFSFDSIATIKAAGISVFPNAYNYIDETPEIHSCYYKLKLLDNDGSYSYSNIVFAQSGYAEPLWYYSGGIIQSICNDNLDLIIYSSDGRVVYTKLVPTGGSIDLQSLSPGVYFVRDAMHSAKAIVIY